MRWLPRSISGQLMALSVLAILVAHLVAVLLLSWWREDNTSIHPLSARTIETRVVSAYRAVSHVPEADALLEGISLPESRFERVDAPPRGVSGMDAQERALADSLRSRLELPPQLPIGVHLLKVDSRLFAQEGDPIPNWMEGALKADHAWALDVDVGFPDGRWLHSRHWPTMMPAHWSRVLSFSLIVGMAPAALIAILFGRRIMRPLRMLTEAAKRVSRGERLTLAESNAPDGIREIIRGFNDAQESLIRFVSGRTQMIASIGHDLRTPLTSLRIRAELIEDAELREAMIRTLNEMTFIVEETLRFASDDATQEPTQEVRIDRLVGETVDAQRVLGRDVAWDCGIEPGFAYRCRPLHLKRALNNLIDNAVRYGGVRVHVTRDPARHVLLVDVDDAGPGIAPDKIEQAFEPFARLDPARSPELGGVGLGLAIARSSVRAHGGDVHLCNRPEGGLRARIELPL